MIKPLACLAISAAFHPLVLQAGNLELAMTEQGVEIDSPAGQFTLPLPNLTLSEEDYEGRKPQVSVKDKTHAVAQYPGNLKIEVSIEGENVTYALSLVPSDAKGLRFGMLVPTSLSKTGGNYSFNGETPVAFPAEGKDQFLFSADAHSFQISDESGDGLEIAPPPCWQGLQDNRVFGWDTFQYQFQYDFKSAPDQKAFTISFRRTGP